MLMRMDTDSRSDVLDLIVTSSDVQLSDSEYTHYIIEHIIVQ